MSDQCRYCSIRGLSVIRCADLKDTDCPIPESWYAQELKAALAEKDTEIAKLRQEIHDPDCDSQSQIIKNMPCNCYIKYKTEAERLRQEAERLQGIIDKHSQAITMDTLAEATRKNYIIGGWKP